jgi:hypothetical protein
MEWALAHAARGFKVFPLREDDFAEQNTKVLKRPLPGSNGCLDATTDEAQIRRWWAKGNFNIGIATGAGLCVLDYDMGPDQEGAESLLDHDDRGLPLDGMCTETPSGGKHFFFRTNSEIPSTAGRVAKDVDVRCHHGYVVAPGSTIHGKPYVLSDGTIPQLPDWMAQLAMTSRTKSTVNARQAVVDELDQPHQIDAAIRYLEEDAPEAVQGSGGDTTTYRIACEVRGFGLEEPTIFELMRDHWNDTKAHPPWPHDELETKVANACAYATLPAGIKDAKGEFGDGDIQNELDALSAAARATGLKAVADWDDPIDLWLDESAPPDLAEGVLPQALERWVRDETKRLGVSYGAGAVAAVVACATALSSAFRVQPKQHNSGHTEAPILWGAIVGPPGARKSPLLAAFMRPIEQIERELSKSNQDARKKYEVDHQEWKRRVKNGETLPEPEKPRARRKLVQDTTTEALAEILAANSDGVLCHLDELAQWAGNMDSYRPGKSTSRDQPFWLQAKNGGHYRADRVTRDPVHIEVTAVHVLGGIQPDVIRKLAPEWGGNGMLQRFLLAIMGQANQELDADPDAEAQQVIYGALQRLHEFRPSEFFDTFKFEPEAEAVRKRLVGFRDATIASGVPVPLEGWLSKLEGEWARLSLVFHAIEWSANAGGEDPFEGPPEMISAQTAERAARFLLDFQYPQQVAFYRDVAGVTAAADNMARRIAGHILTYPQKTFGERDMERACSSLRGAQKRLLRLDVAQTLELYGWLRPTGRINRDGGHNDQWEVNPKIYDGRFERRTATERAVRAAQQASIKASADARRRAQQETPEWAD